MTKHGFKLQIPNTSKLLSIAALSLAMLVGAATASADITITFTETADGGFLVAGTGSGQVSLTSDGTPDYDFNEFTTNFLSDTSINNVFADSASGTLTNLTSSTSVAVTNFKVDSDGVLPQPNMDDVELTTENIAFAAGDEFTLEFTATYLGSGTPNFSSLNVGTHTLTPDSESVEEIFGTVTIIVTSAPTPVLLGDVDMNGVVNFLDIAPFISYLTSGDFKAQADCNEDGNVNFLDISVFIAILSSGGE